MSIKILNDAEYHSIDIDEVKDWKEDYTSFYPDNLFQTLKISIKEQGIKVPVQLVRKDDNWYCVDGLRRLQAVRELMKQNEWKHEFVPAVVNSPDNIEDAYAACAFQKKTLTKSQKAFFAAKWYYDDVKKLAEENKKLNDNGIAVTQKIYTSLTVAQRVGLNTPDHVAKAYQLLKFDSWFYEFTYKQGFPFANTDVKELVSLFKTDKKRAIKIVKKMKELVENSKLANDVEDVYKIAVTEVTVDENQCYNQNEIEDFKNLDINEITHINDNSTKSNKVQHAKSAQRNLQIDKNSEIIKEGSIGIVFKTDTSEEMIDMIKIALKNCKLNPIVIKTADELTSFIGNNDDTTTLEQENNQ